MTILVADDEDLVRNVVVRLLQYLGHEVVEANTGEAALATLKDRSDIELALLDEQMPGLRGTEVLERMREFHPKIPVLLSSGNVGIEANDPYALVLGKPYRLDMLEAALTKVTALC